MTSLYIQLQTKVGFVQYAKIMAQVSTGAQKPVKLFEHPKRAFEIHAKNKQHKLVEEQKQLSK